MGKQNHILSWIIWIGSRARNWIWLWSAKNQQNSRNRQNNAKNRHSQRKRSKLPSSLELLFVDEKDIIYFVHQNQNCIISIMYFYKLKQAKIWAFYHFVLIRAPFLNYFYLVADSLRIKIFMKSLSTKEIEVVVRCGT